MIDLKVIKRTSLSEPSFNFTYNGVHFNNDTLNIFPGLCAVDSKQHVESMLKALKANNIVCTRMGAYKPRTNPYSFQGLGEKCLPYVFELAGKYGVKVIAMEVTDDRQIESIFNNLNLAGNPTGIMLQIGTRNAQNFELLESVGRQNTFPVLIKRGFGISLEESLNAVEYTAKEGNTNIIFCLRGLKSIHATPHRNFVDFSQVPVVKRLTKLNVCIDPSHSVGIRDISSDKIMDIFHATAQGVIAGASMALVDFHPNRNTALVDGTQALGLNELPWFLEDLEIAHQAYKKRKDLALKYLNTESKSESESDAPLAPKHLA